MEEKPKNGEAILVIESFWRWVVLYIPVNQMHLHRIPDVIQHMLAAAIIVFSPVEMQAFQNVSRREKTPTYLRSYINAVFRIITKTQLYCKNSPVNKLNCTLINHTSVSIIENGQRRAKKISIPQKLKIRHDNVFNSMLLNINRSLIDTITTSFIWFT